MVDSTAVLFGASLANPNLGVNALAISALMGLTTRCPSTHMYLFDHGRGVRPVTNNIFRSGMCTQVGVRWTRNWLSPDALTRMCIGAKHGYSISKSGSLIRHARCAFDINGGDSFTDLYGLGRFLKVVACSKAAIDAGRALVFLPQTIGPFKSRVARDTAKNILNKCNLVIARDADSFARAEDLMRPDHRNRLRHGVDLAFLLPRSPVNNKSFGKDSAERVLIGYNVSGLIWHNPARSRDAFGFRCDYKELVLNTLGALLRDESVHIALLSHVNEPKGHFESDPQACEEVLSNLISKEQNWKNRIQIVALPTAPEVKDFIAGCDWFCGTRMHSTIAGLSSGVPTATIAYSDKAKGVFESCGQGAHVMDPRSMDTGEIVERLLASFRERDEARASLAERLPGVLAQAERQMDEVAAFLRTTAECSSRPRTA